MSLLTYKIIAALLIFFSSMGIAIYFIRRKRGLHHDESFLLGEALASGIFLGAAFFHMLPDAIKSFAQITRTISYPIPEAICVSGFLLMLFLERLSIINKSSRSIPYVLALILIIHAVIEGAALGIGNTYSEIVMLLIAILAHKGSETFALSLSLWRHQLPLRHIYFIVIFFALMTPIGIAFGTGVNAFSNDEHGLLASGIFNAFAAGTFIYISTMHHVRFHQHAEKNQGLLEFASLVFGLVVMGVIALWT